MHIDRSARLRDTSLRQWRAVILQTARDLWACHVVEWAATLAFYSMLSLFPLLLIGLILASYVTDAAWATRHAMALLQQFLPEGEAQVESIVTGALAERRRAGVVSLLLLMVTGRRVFGALTKGLNAVSDVNPQEEPVLRRVAVEIALAMGLILLGLAALAAGPLVRLAWETMEVVPGRDGMQVSFLRRLIRIPLFFGCFALVFAYVPRGRRHWRAVVVGAVVATLLLLLAQALFALLVTQLWPTWQLVYGPVAIATLLLSWAWYVAAITLVGGAVASHIKVMVIEQTSALDTARRHQGGAET